MIDIVLGQPIGEIYLTFNVLNIENITLTEKLRMLTTQDVKYHPLTLSIINSNMRNNSLEKGYMFEFKHNFRMVKFDKCLI
jgi:hypothetical protein